MIYIYLYIYIFISICLSHWGLSFTSSKHVHSAAKSTQGYAGFELNPGKSQWYSVRSTKQKHLHTDVGDIPQVEVLAVLGHSICRVQQAAQQLSMVKGKALRLFWSLKETWQNRKLFRNRRLKLALDAVGSLILHYASIAHWFTSHWKTLCHFQNRLAHQLLRLPRNGHERWLE